MRASFGLARTELRRSWRPLLGLGLLVGVVGAAVLGPLAAARRTATAYDRLEEATHIDDVRLLVFAPGLAERAAELPSVQRAWIADFAVGKPEREAEQYFGIAAGPARPKELFRPIVVKGRMFRDDRVEELIVAERFAEEAGLKPGDDFPMRLLTTEEFGLFNVGFGEPDGPRIPFRIVGTVRLPSAEEAFGVFIGSPALSELVTGDLSGGQVAMLRLRGGLAALDRFRAEVGQIARTAEVPPGAFEYEPYDETLPRSSRTTVTAASAVLVSGLLVFGGVVLVVGGFIVVQAVGRYSARSGEEQTIERALGMTGAERLLARAIPAIVPALIGAGLAIGGAIAVSPLTPIGSVAFYEPNPGIDANVALLAAGGTTILTATIGVFALAAYRAVRTLPAGERRSASRIAERLGAAGASTPIIVGLRFALERGRGRTAVPVRSAFIGATLGVAGVIAVTSFAASLDRLTTTPERYGWQGHLQIIDLKDEQRAAMLADPRVADFATIDSAQAGLPDGRLVPVTSLESLRGSLAWTMFEGRMPATPDEVAIGPRLAGRLKVDVGGVMEFATPSGGEPLRKAVVGIGIGPSATNAPFGDAVTMTKNGFEGVARTQAFREGYIRLADGVDPEAFATELGAEAEVSTREPPAEVRNLIGLGRLPDALTTVLALIAVAAIANALLVGVRRRRRDIAILRSLGFVRSQVARAVQTSALTMTLTGLLVGIPIGLVIGRTVWRPVAEAAYVAGDAAWPASTLALVAPAALLVALAASALPALRAARLSPAVILRSE